MLVGPFLFVRACNGKPFILRAGNDKNNLRDAWISQLKGRVYRRVAGRSGGKPFGENIRRRHEAMPASGFADPALISFVRQAANAAMGLGLGPVRGQQWSIEDDIASLRCTDFHIILGTDTIIEDDRAKAALTAKVRAAVAESDRNSNPTSPK